MGTRWSARAGASPLSGGVRRLLVSWGLLRAFLARAGAPHQTRSHGLRWCGSGCGMECSLCSCGATLQIVQPRHNRCARVAIGLLRTIRSLRTSRAVSGLVLVVLRHRLGQAIAPGLSKSRLAGSLGIESSKFVVPAVPEKARVVPVFAGSWMLRAERGGSKRRFRAKNAYLREPPSTGSQPKWLSAGPANRACIPGKSLFAPFWQNRPQCSQTGWCEARFGGDFRHVFRTGNTELCAISRRIFDGGFRGTCASFSHYPAPSFSTVLTTKTTCASTDFRAFRASGRA